MSEDLKMENLLPLSPELSSRINQNARLMQSPQETFFDLHHREGSRLPFSQMRVCKPRLIILAHGGI
jgi:hypothetical protein